MRSLAEEIARVLRGRAANPRWIAGMMLFDVLIRMSMAHAYAHGGGSLLAAVLTHAMINVCISTFPNAGSHFNPWLFALWAGGLLAVQLGVARRGKLFSA